MSQTSYVRILEIMASKICHDIISPVGAIANGIEIMEELGPDAGEDVTQLISHSATQASAKLKTLRLAYGLGGSDSSIIPEDVHKIFGDFIAGENRVTQNWDPNADLGIEPQTGFSKILICTLLLAIEALPKGGEISVQKEDDQTTVVTAQGDNAQFREGYISALKQETSENNIEPQHTHAYITGLLASHYGFTIDVDESKSNFIYLRLRLSHVS